MVRRGGGARSGGGVHAGAPRRRRDGWGMRYQRCMWREAESRLRKDDINNAVRCHPLSHCWHLESTLLNLFNHLVQLVYTALKVFGLVIEVLDDPVEAVVLLREVMVGGFLLSRRRCKSAITGDRVYLASTSIRICVCELPMSRSCASSADRRESYSSSLSSPKRALAATCSARWSSRSFSFSARAWRHSRRASSSRVLRCRAWAAAECAWSRRSRPRSDPVDWRVIRGGGGEARVSSMLTRTYRGWTRRWRKKRDGPR